MQDFNSSLCVESARFSSVSFGTELNARSFLSPSPIHDMAYTETIQHEIY